MGGPGARVGTGLAAARSRVIGVCRSRTARKSALIVSAVLIVYGLLGFLAAPPVIRAQIQRHASADLGRAVTVQRVRFDPYTLRLQLDHLVIAGRTEKAPLLAIDRAVINASWTSLFRMAPVLDALILQQPRVRIARTAPRQFNFSDILQRLAAQSSNSRSPFRYAVSNIEVHDGAVTFTDAVTRSTHRIDHVDIGIPFLANLPRNTDIRVQPLLAMDVDGSPIRITGQTKPFARNRESTLDFHFARLDLPRYLAYAPEALPVAISAGQLGGDLTLHFLQTPEKPEVRLSGTLQLDGLAVDGRQHQPILKLRHGELALVDVEPLGSRYAFGAIRLDGAQLWYTASSPGHSNLDALLAPSKPASPGAESAPPTDLRVASLALAESAFHYTDADGHALDLTGLHGTITGIAQRKAPPARLDLAWQLAGGTIAANGTLDLAVSQLAATLTLRQVGLAPLQDVAALPLDGHTANGKLSAAGKVRLDWGKMFNVQLADAHASIDNFALQPRGGDGVVPVAWQQLDVALEQLDVAKRTAAFGAITVDGLALDVERLADRRIKLLELLGPPPAGGAPGPKSPAWHWHVATIGFQHAAVTFTDHAAGSKQVVVRLDNLDGNIANLDDKLDTASPVKLSGAAGRGRFQLSGTLRPMPLAADLEIDAKRLGLAAFEPYLGIPLNVTLARAAITGRGRLQYNAGGGTPRVAYRGDAALDNVSIRDKLTGDDFLRWRQLRATGIDARVGTGTPRIDIGHLALTAFYARMIINADGRLNVSDVIANPSAQPVSVTRANDQPAARAPAPAAVATGAVTAATTAAATPAPPVADISIGGITLAYGQLNFTDDFIKPNYTANLTRLHGTIGAFGTAPGAPAAQVALQAKLNDNAPVAINGSVNPLQPQAQLDIVGKATGVELTRMSTYATQYTGYPITGGLLDASVHYRLDQRKLSADNHFFITQLSFGNRDESPGVKHLPVKLAVALLKDSQGNVDINLPVSGSLDDPHFSVGGLVWRAVVGLITKAVTAPFHLLAAAFGSGQQQALEYVAFAPGSAVLDKNAEAALGRIAAMLQQKPGLQLELTARVDPAQDVPGLRKVTVDDLIHRAKLLDTDGKGADLSSAALAAVEITPDEYVKYLKRAYRSDDIKGKPRDYFGLKLPKPAEMRNLMEANVPTDGAALAALADQRADAVRTWLVAHRLAADRITIAKPKLNADGIDDKGPPTRVQFGIAQR